MISRAQLPKLPLYVQLGAAVTGLILLIILGVQYRHNSLYNLSSTSRHLLTKSSIDSSKIIVTSKTIRFNAATQKPAGKSQVTIAAPIDSTGKTGYHATINTDFKKGLDFGDNSSELSFNMTPLFDANKAQYQNGQVMFPVSGSTKVVQTFKKNGVKEDIILSKAPANTDKWQWRLNLNDKLAAKLLPDGSVGVFSANPALFGNLQISDAKSQALVDKARVGTKDYLLFAIPAPTIKNANGQTRKGDVIYKLAGNTLTLEARNLRNQHYPISIDPSVVITTTADFATGNDDGSIDYSTPNQIGRSNISLGTVGATVRQINAFTTPRYQQASVAYNGYIFISGGMNNANIEQNDIIHCPINADGSVGACVQQTNAFTTARRFHASVAYNGYLYIIGGDGSGYLNDIQRCPINVDGNVGTCIVQNNAFTNGRFGHTSVIYNGYLYIIGGFDGATYLGDILHCPINADGSVGTCVDQANAIVGNSRFLHTSVAYNGYLYVIGGYDGIVFADKNDIQHCPLKADGSLGACVAQTNAFPTPRISHTSVASNGYLYVIGGADDSYTIQNDILNCPINADGSVGTCAQQTNAYAVPRYHHSAAAYNGYMYVIGGYSGVKENDIQHIPINTGTPTGFGAVGAPAAPTGTFTTPRSGHTSVAYNGYVYVIGGSITSGAPLNDIIHCPVNADGSVGICAQQPNALNSGVPRTGHTSFAYAGNLYVIGGMDNSFTKQNDIQRCPINADGSVNTCVVAGSFATARTNASSLVYNGFLYISGGSAAGTSYQNDIQRCPISADGSIGACVPAGSFTTARSGHTSAAYNGNLYVIGGSDGVSVLNDIQHLPIFSPSQSAHYERTVDLGGVGGRIDSFQYNGTAQCGAKIQYASAGLNGLFSALTTLKADALPGTTYPLSGQSSLRYVRLVVTLNDQSCGGTSTITDLSVNYTPAPEAPTLMYPASDAIGVSAVTTFTLQTTSTNPPSYAKYKILIYQSDCTTLVRTIDQTLSQTGWNGQDASAGTAYVLGTTLGASTLASQTAATLSFSITYCWKAAAIDPGGSNTWSAFSAAQRFTINQPPAAPVLKQPSAGQTRVSILPELRLVATDPDGDYTRYKIQVCSTSNCSGIVRTIDQSAATAPPELAQVGWLSQSLQNMTAYASGQTAIHTYQAPALAISTQYWWRAYAIDPGGGNVFGLSSAIGTFTTGPSIKPDINVNGNSTIYGGATLHP